jgi:hypothetical protein
LVGDFGFSRFAVRATDAAPARLALAGIAAAAKNRSARRLRQGTKGAHRARSPLARPQHSVVGALGRR